MKLDNKTWTLLAPVVVLTSICLVVTAALAVANHFTAPVIAAAQQAAADAAKLVVLPLGADFTDLPEDQLPPDVDAVSKAGNGAGYVFTVTTQGYGQITVLVGIDSEGKVAGTQVIAQDETQGIGAPVVADGSDFQQRLIGVTDPSTVAPVSGATKSSDGIKKAVQAALDGNTVLNGGKVEVKLATTPPESLTEEKLAATYPGVVFTEVPGGLVSDAGTVVFGEAKGMESTVRVAVCFDPEGTILNVVAYTRRETEYLGEGVGDDSAFMDQFLGTPDLSSIQAVSGSTVTSVAVKDAVKQAITNLATVKGAA